MNMTVVKFNPKWLLLFVFLLAVSLLRIIFVSQKGISPLSNFTPIGAMALFGAAYFNSNAKAYGWPLICLFIGDYILSLTVYKQYNNGFLYAGWYWVYGAFALMTLAGRWILKEISVKNIFMAAMVSTLIHWLVTDFGVWLHGSLYPKNMAGFIDCLIAAIPFEARFLTGTLVYGALLFGSFEWMKRHTRIGAHPIAISEKQ
jgi:hypothetical protein